MLARTYNPSTFSSFPCYLQKKLNGVRCLYSCGTFQSRDEKIFPPFLVSHILQELYIFNIPHTVITDGEIYVHGWHLQRINGALATNRKEPSPDSLLLEYHIFDIIDTEHFQPFSQRFINNRLRLMDSPHVHFVETSVAHEKVHIDNSFLFWTKEGYEGIMLRPDGPYELGARFSPRVHKDTEYRSEYLWKYKKWMDAEFWCIGTTAGLGKADIGIGALVCLSTIDGTSFNVGTGYEDDERIEFAKNPPIGKYIKVKFIGYSEDGLPLNPSFLCVMN